MLKFVVLGSDLCHRKGGLSHSPLVRFLQIFYSRKQLHWLNPAELDRRRPLSTDCLLIETPTQLRPEDLASIRSQQVVLFDESDRWWFKQAPEQDWLVDLADLCLKTHVDRTVDYPLRMGTLPLYRKPKLKWTVRRKQWRDAWGRSPCDRPLDLFFTGAPTRLQLTADGSGESYSQRSEWVAQAKADSFPYQFVGGLDASNRQLRETIERDEGNLSELYADRRYNFFAYFEQMCRAKVVLAPSGFARWTYRHYEAVYAKAAIVSTDLSNIELFVPMPPHIIEVPDRAPILESVEQAVDLFEQHPERLEENVEFLEHYYERGCFSRRRPRVLEHFLRQFEPDFDLRSDR